MQTKDLCSGVCLTRDAKAFFTVQQKTKDLALFELKKEVRVQFKNSDITKPDGLFDDKPTTEIPILRSLSFTY